MSSKWIPRHRDTINSFLKFLNAESDDYVLKGGTALLTCYGLDRFSEDIDLDGKSGNIIDITERFCAGRGFTYRIAKDTETVKRCLINYGNESKPLKVEVSYRRREIPGSETQRVNGIRVYKIEPLCVMKANAYSGRDRIRDLYDLTFICNRYFEQLTPQSIALVRAALEYKGIEQFDYIVRQQPDELIDAAKLADDFLGLFDKLGLLYDKSESEMIHAIESGAVNHAPEDTTGAPRKLSIHERIDNAQAERQGKSGTDHIEPERDDR